MAEETDTRTATTVESCVLSIEFSWRWNVRALVFFHANILNGFVELGRSDSAQQQLEKPMLLVCRDLKI